MNRDRLEKELHRFEEEILSGLDKPPGPPPDHFNLLPPPPIYPNVAIPDPSQFRPLLPGNIQTFQQPVAIDSALLHPTPSPPPSLQAQLYTQPVKQPYLPPQPIPMTSFCIPTQTIIPLLTVHKPPPFIPTAVQANINNHKDDKTDKSEEASSSVPKKTPKRKTLDKRKKKLLRSAAGQIWLDNSMEDWDPDDYRIFCGDLGNEVNDDTLLRAFSPYKSLQKVKVIRDKRSHKSKGYGFASFKDPKDFLSALKEVNGRYIGNRPVKLRKSIWKDRSLEMVKKKTVEKKKLGLR
ncbi:RNA-binding protein 42-like [Oopsacas minuta]|uniref:RNA-binding protein 42 n=1 Tax=Oopsacas minuta TaxID=111878 RepID=A0AAV7JXD0_9METZ|nr:RNA-binding protein 42-like [Oopsacas minuta]